MSDDDPPVKAPDDDDVDDKARTAWQLYVTRRRARWLAAAVVAVGIANIVLEVRTYARSGGYLWLVIAYLMASGMTWFAIHVQRNLDDRAMDLNFLRKRFREELAAFKAEHEALVRRGREMTPKRIEVPSTFGTNEAVLVVAVLTLIATVIAVFK